MHIHAAPPPIHRRQSKWAEAERLLTRALKKYVSLGAPLPDIGRENTAAEAEEEYGVVMAQVEGRR